MKGRSPGQEAQVNAESDAEDLTDAQSIHHGFSATSDASSGNLLDIGVLFLSSERLQELDESPLLRHYLAQNYRQIGRNDATRTCHSGTCFSAGQLGHRPESAEADAATLGTPGRFSFAATRENDRRDPYDLEVFPLDTTTGKAWCAMRSTADKIFLGSSPSQTKWLRLNPPRELAKRAGDRVGTFEGRRVVERG